MLEILVLLGAGAVGGGIMTYAIVWVRYGGWFLPQNTTMVLSVDRDGYGHLWRVDEVLDRGLVKIPGGKGYLQLDPKAGIWLKNPRVKLFLHYMDYFRVVPPKYGAFFTFFKKKHEIQAADPKEYDAIERQEENQPGVAWNIADVMHWVREITSAQLLEGVTAAAIKEVGKWKIILEGEGAGVGGWLKWLLIALLAGGGVFLVLTVLPKMA